MDPESVRFTPRRLRLINDPAVWASGLVATVPVDTRRMRAGLQPAAFGDSRSIRDRITSETVTMLNAVSDLPFAEQADIEPDALPVPASSDKPFPEFESLLVSCGYSLASHYVEGGWHVEDWSQKSREGVHLRWNCEHNFDYGTWYAGTFQGPMHKPRGLDVLRFVLTGETAQ